jgi:hypothetical protein
MATTAMRKSTAKLDHQVEKPLRLTADLTLDQYATGKSPDLQALTQSNLTSH